MSEVGVVDCRTADEVRQINRRVKEFRKKFTKFGFPGETRDAQRAAEISDSNETPDGPSAEIITAPIPVFRPYAVFRETPTASDIIEIVCDFYGKTKIELLAHRRNADTAFVRHIACYLMHELTTLSCGVMGRQLRRDHSTVLYGAAKIKAALKEDSRLADELDLLKIKIAERMIARNASDAQ